MSNEEYTPDYLEALHKSIVKKENSDEEKTETDSSEERKKRVNNEQYVAEHLDNLKGRSLYERILYIRENLFDKDVSGDKPMELRKTDFIGNGIYPDNDFTEYAFSEYVKLMDSMDTFVKEMDESKRPEAGHRLAAMTYSLGIMSHLFVDGNGQTLRLVALSYIQEYDPNSREKHFPIKEYADSPQPIDFDFIPYVMDSIGYLQDDGIMEGSKTEKFLRYALTTTLRKNIKSQVLDSYKEYLESGVYNEENLKVGKWTKEVLSNSIQMYKELEKNMKDALV